MGHPFFIAQQWLQHLIIALNNFIQYSHCQVVQLFRLMFLSNKNVQSFTTIIPEHIVCLALCFQTKVHCVWFIKTRATPFISFSCWNDHSFLWLQMLRASLNKGVKRFTKLILRIGWHWFTTLLAVQAYNLSSKLPTQTHQLMFDSKPSLTSTFTLVPSLLAWRVV